MIDCLENILYHFVIESLPSKLPQQIHQQFQIRERLVNYYRYLILTVPLYLLLERNQTILYRVRLQSGEFRSLRPLRDFGGLCK